MKTCLVNNFPRYTGAGKYAFNLFYELKKINYQIEMHYFFEGKKEKGVNNIEFDFRLPFLDNTLKNIYFIPRKIPHDHDLYHATNQFLSQLAVHRKPCIVTCLDIIPVTQKKYFNPVLRHFLKKAIDGLKKAHHILAISNYTKNELVEKLDIPKEKISVTYLGVDKSVFFKKNKNKARREFGLQSSNKIILNIGSEEQRKGVDIALKAFSIVAKNFPEAIFVRVGEKTKKIEKLAKQLGLHKNIFYFSFMDEEKLSLLYSAADLLMFCSSQEGFGLPLLEAAACGTPIICNDNSSVKEITQGNAFFAKTLHENDFAEQVLKCLSEKNIAKRVAINGMQNAKNFSWEKCANETLKVYKGFENQNKLLKN